MDKTLKQAQEQSNLARRGVCTTACTVVFHICWVLIAALALRERLSIPREPFIDPDVWGYLKPAIQKLIGGVFAQTSGRAFVYPSYLYLLLGSFRDFKVITLVQHLLGVGTGLLLLWNWMMTRRLLPKPMVPRAIHALLGLAMLAIFLFSTQPIVQEHYLRPEGVSPFFVALGFLFTVRFLIAKYREEDSVRTTLFGAASVCTALLLPMLKPSYWLTSFLTTLPVWVHLFDRREKIGRRLLCTAGPLAAAVLLLWIPQVRYAAANPKEPGFWDESTFTIHAVQIREQMAQDVATHPAGLPYPPETIRQVFDLLDSELELSRSGKHNAVAALGFDPDYLLYQDSFCSKLPTIIPAVEDRAAFCQYYFLRTWRNHPAGMLVKIAKQLALFYSWQCPVYHSRNVSIQELYTSSAPLLESKQYPRQYRAFLAKFPPLKEYADSLKRLADFPTAMKQPTILRKATDTLSHAYLAELLLFGAIAGWLLFSARDRTRLGLFCVVVAIGYAYNFGNNLSIAFLHSLWVGRYSQVQFVTTILVQFQTVILLAETLLAKRDRSQVSAEAPVE
jgi:hypothetical protein